MKLIFKKELQLELTTNQITTLRNALQQRQNGIEVEIRFNCQAAHETYSRHIIEVWDYNK